MRGPLIHDLQKFLLPEEMRSGRCAVQPDFAEAACTEAIFKPRPRTSSASNGQTDRGLHGGITSLITQELKPESASGFSFPPPAFPNTSFIMGEGLLPG